MVSGSEGVEGPGSGRSGTIDGRIPAGTHQGAKRVSAPVPTLFDHGIPTAIQKPFSHVFLRPGLQLALSFIHRVECGEKDVNHTMPPLHVPSVAAPGMRARSRILPGGNEKTAIVIQRY